MPCLTQFCCLKMSLDWNDIKYFLTVARCKSLPAAAASLGVNHSTVLRRVDQMESRIGLTLFIREKGLCTLTEAGNAFLINARRMEESASMLERLVFDADDQSMAGTILVSAADFVVTKLLLPKVNKFTEAYPGLNISFVTTNAFLDLGRREADVVVRLTDNPKEHLPANLFGRKIGHVEMCGYQGKTAQQRQLVWNCWDQSVNFDNWLLDNGYPAYPKASIFNSVLVQLEAIKSTNSAAILPTFVADDDAGVKRIKGCKPFAAFEAWLLTHPDLKGISRIEATMSFLSDAIGNALK